MIPTPLTHPPGTNAAHPGIFKHGGHIVSVSDLRYLFGVEQDQWLQPGRTIINELTEGHVGFWVDEIIDVIEFPEKGWGNLPPHLPRGVFSRTLLLKEHIHLYAEFEKLNTLKSAGYLKQYIASLIEQEKVEVTKTEHKPTTTVNKEVDQVIVNNKTPLTKAKPSTEVSTTKQPATVTSRIPTPDQLRQLPHKEKINSSKKPSATLLSTKTTKATAENQVTPSTETRKPVDYTPHTEAGNNTSRPQTVAHTTQVKTDSRSEIINRKSRSRIPPVFNETNKPSNIAEPQPTPIRKSNPPSQYGPVNNGTGGLWILLLLLILFAGSGYGVFHYLLDTPVKPQKRISYDDPQRFDPSPVEPPVTQLKDFQKANESIAAIDEQNIPEPSNIEEIHQETKPMQETELSSDSTIENQPEIETTESTAIASEEAESNTGYHASIEKDEQGITIILHQPVSEEKTQASEDIKQQETRFTTEQVESNEKNFTETISQQKQMRLTETEQETVIEPAPVKEATPPIVEKIEIIHVVVKGDTLWHIARRYVENPFLYPELARLSNIKNPHLIYPGNKVRIIKYLNK